MKKQGVLLLSILFSLFLSCEIGLGSAVDTQVPEISIESPEADSTIRDSFIFRGSWSDDGSISSVAITLTDTETDAKFGAYPVVYELLKNGKGSWHYVVEKDSIPDGTYEATVTIKDNASHQNAIQRQITIDNTSPVLIMQRPVSKNGTTGTIESYGRIFAIEGQAADDSGIGSLDVNVYSDEKLEHLIKTIPFTNVPKTISLDVAKFIQNEINDYSEIYGSTDYQAGKKTLYCKIIAYDGAKRYPVDGSDQTEADLKGNATTGYYIYNDVAADILNNYKITDLYSMKNGRYTGSQSARSAAIDNLAKYEITSNVFTLNPKNNPTFTVAGFTEMSIDGDFEAANMSVGNGDFLTIQVEPGLDGYLLVKDSIKVKLRSETNQVINVSEQSISKDGDKYKIVAFMRKEDGLVSTKKYSIEVEGYDEQGNVLTTPLGIGYGFYFAKSITTPSLFITEPAKEDTVIYNASSNNLTIQGTINFPGDLCDGGDVVIEDLQTGTKWKVGSFATNTNEQWAMNLKFRKDNTDTEYSAVDVKGQPVIYNYLTDNEWDLYIYAEYYELDDVAHTDKKTTEKIKRSFTIDTKAPKTPELIEVNRQSYDETKWYTSQNLSIKVTSEDEARDSYLSGVAKTEYKVNDGEWMNLNSTTEGYLNGLKEGLNELYFRNTDNVGNVSDVNSVATKLLVDTLRPVVKKAYIGDKGSDDGTSSAAWDELTTGTVLNINSSHKKYLKLEIDENNNLGSVTVTVGGVQLEGTVCPKASDEENWIWVSNAEAVPENDETIIINISATDEAGGTGTAAYKFLVDTTGPVITITAPEFDPDVEGAISSQKYTLKASVSDAAGNVALTKYKISATPLADEAAILADFKNNGASWLASVNTGSVNKEITINEGNGSTVNIAADGAISISEGEWYLYVYSKDNAGNESAEKRLFWTDRKDPTLDVTNPPADKYNKADSEANNKITVSGTASDANGIDSSYGVKYSTDGGTSWSDNILDDSGNWTFSKTYGSAGADLEDNKYTFVIQTKDTAGKTTVKTYEILIDTNEPRITSGQIKNRKTWFKVATVQPEVIVEDDTSDISKVEYQINGQGEWKTLTNLDGKWTGGVSFTENDENQWLKLRATDEAGNTCEDSEKITGINIDAAAPSIQAKYYQIGEKSVSDKLDDIAWLDGTSKLTIWGSYSDSVSGVADISVASIDSSNIPDYGFFLGSTGTPLENVTVKYSTEDLPNDKAAITSELVFVNYDEANKKTIKSWKVEIENAKLSSGDLSVSGKDIAGNLSNKPIVLITKDTNAPVISNVTVTDNSTEGTEGATKAYRSSADGEPLVYWVNNSSEKTFTIEGVSTDDNRVANTKLVINNASTDYTNSGSVTSWKFTVSNLNTFTTTEVSAKIITTDLASNKTETPITLKFDSTAPVFKHGIDKKGKDVDFRIGEYKNDAGHSDVGGKYKAGTWGNTKSLMIRGTLEENASGSGLSKIYYKVFKENPPTEDDITAFIKDKSSTYIEADSTLESKSVDYTNKDGAKKTVPVKSSFKGEVSGLEEGENYLLLLAEDNVGNLGIDTMTATAAETDVELTNEIKALWNNNKNYYSLNVDTAAPEITSKGSQDPKEKTKFSNGRNTPVVIEGTYSDVGSGLIDEEKADDEKLKIQVSVTINGSKKTVIAKIEGDGNAKTGSWKATIPNEDLGEIEDGKTYNIEATATDLAGLSKSITAAILQGDTSAPVPSLISISPSVERSSGYYIRPTQDDITIKGSTDDTYSTTVYTWLKIVPYSESEGTATEDTSDEAVKYLGKEQLTTDRAWTLTIDKDYLDNSYSGANIYACTKDLAGNEATTSTPLAKLIFDEEAPVFNSGDTQVGGESNASTWHKSRTLSLKGSWSDAAGIDKIYYKRYSTLQTTIDDDVETITKNWATFTGAESNGKYWFENTIDSFDEGNNYVYLYAVDKLGNDILWLDSGSTPKKEPLTIKVDTVPPKATEYTDEVTDKTYSFSDIYLTNGGEDKLLYFYVEDDYSGIDTSSKEISLGGTKLTDSTVTFEDTETAGKMKVTVNLDKDELDGNGYRAVVVTLKDRAGNYADITIGTINLDQTHPTVSLSAPKDADSETEVVQVNGTIEISGTANDTYLEDRPLTHFQYTTTPAVESSWKDLYDDYSATNTNITNKADFTVIIDSTDSTKFTDGTTYYVRAEVADKAGNKTTSSETISFTVDQDTDRPVIKFTDLSLPVTSGAVESKAILTMFTSSLRGTITDDDGITKLEISTNGGATDADFTEISVNGGSWTYSFSTKDAEENILPGDGTYEILFRVTDGSSKKFITGECKTPSSVDPEDTESPADKYAKALQKTPKLTDGTNWLGLKKREDSLSTESYTNFSLMVDTLPPQWTELKYKLSSLADTDANWSDSIPKLGGPDTSASNEFDIKIKAGDENGIASISTIIDDDDNSKKEATILTEEGQEEKVGTKWFTEWKLSGINVKDLSNGSHSLVLTIKDGANNEKQETINLTVDKEAPAINIISPNASTTSSGSVWAKGGISGAKENELYYAISPSRTQSPNGSAVADWEDYEGNPGNCSGASLNPAYTTKGMEFGNTWNIYFDGTDPEEDPAAELSSGHNWLLNDYLVKYGITTEAALNAKDNTQFAKLVKLYLWVKAVDEVGNIAEKKFPIIVDPQGDRPLISYTYPADNSDPLGGKVTIYGTVEDTKGDNPGVKTVWVQMISGTHWNADGTKDTSSGYGNVTDFSLTTKDLDYLKAKGYSVYNMNIYKADDESTHVEWNGTGSASDYAVLATLSGTAWLLDINANKEFNPDTSNTTATASTNKVAIRIYACDGDDKFSINNDKLVEFDANKPVISNLRLVRYDDAGEEIADQLYINGSETFLKDEWWLTGQVNDPNDIGELTIGKTKLVKNKVIQTVTDASADFADAVDPDTGNPVVDPNTGDPVKDKTTVFFKYKLGTGKADSVGSKTFEIEAYDAVSGNPNKQEQKISVKYDNKKPVLATGDDVEINAKVQQLNGFYSLRSRAMEEKTDDGSDQSGFAYTALYFERAYKDNNNNDVVKLYDVLNKRASAEISTNSVELDNETNLYWFKKTLSAETDGTMTIKMSDTSNIRVNSLVRVFGSYYLVKSITPNTSVTLDRNVPAGHDTAEVALAAIVDNTDPEDPDTSGGINSETGYYNSIDRDDGDLMVESVNKDNTTWIWDAAVCSKNIPDGPIEVHYVVFDKAGNCEHAFVKGYVCNNQPRIAGFTIATDYTGNGTAEFEYTDYASDGENSFSSDSITGTKNGKNVYDPYSKSLSKKDYHPLEQEIERFKDNPMMIRGLTQIKPEIVGGNKKVYFKYSIENNFTGKERKGTNKTGLYSEGNGLNYDYLINTSQPINIELGDLVYLGDTKDGDTYKGIPFEFTFMDETEGLSSLSETQQKEFQATLKLYFAINACEKSTPSVTINPFYWNSLTDNSIKDSEGASSYKDLLGHIELEDDWKASDYYTKLESKPTIGEYDADPKVSGQIVINGQASDTKLLSSISITIGTVSKVVAEYVSEDSGTGYLNSKYGKDDYDANGFWFEILTDDEHKQTVDNTGHKVYWKFYWNTQKTGTDKEGKPAFAAAVAQTDVTVKVTAKNFKVPKEAVLAGEGETGTLPGISGNNDYKAINNWDAVEADDSYKMDIVPYVYDVKTSLSSANENNPSVYSRTALGHYPVYMTHEQGNGTYTCEEIEIYGFNLNDGSIVFDNGEDTKSANLDTESDHYKFTLPGGARSGNASIKVGDIYSLNNLNNDSSSVSYNCQPNGENNDLLTDSLIFDVWDINSAAGIAHDNSALDIMMKINPYNGIIGFAFCNGVKRWSMPGKTSDANSYKTYTLSADFIQCTGFGYSSDGNTYGVAAGGESNAGQVDAYVFMTSRWGQSSDKNTGVNVNTRFKIEATGQQTADEKDVDLDKERFKSAGFATLKNGTNENIYLAYYDGITNEIRFRAGILDTSKTDKSKLGNNNKMKQKDKSGNDTDIYYFGNFIDRYKGWENGNGVNPTKYAFTENDCQIVAKGDGSGYGDKGTRKAGEYVSIGVTSNNTVVMVWYDNENLKFSYNTNPLALTTGANADNWSVAETLISGAGLYCQLVVDGADNIHVAAFDSANGDLKYAYIPSANGVPNINGAKVCTVDSYQTVGKELTIDVAKEGDYYIPHIGYYGNTPKKPRYAYLADPENFSKAGSEAARSGTTSSDMYTGIWECGIVPTISTLTAHKMRRINVGVWKKDVTTPEQKTDEQGNLLFDDQGNPQMINVTTKGVRRNSNYTVNGPATDGENKGSSSAAGTDSGTCYGNGTSYAVLGYGVKHSSTQDYVETAQMR